MKISELIIFLKNKQREVGDVVLFMERDTGREIYVDIVRAAIKQKIYKSKTTPKREILSI